jgi:hypothetical protein
MLWCVYLPLRLDTVIEFKIIGARRRRENAQQKCYSGNGVSIGVFIFHLTLILITYDSEQNIHAMRQGPGKHLKGLSLFGGIVKPEEVSSHCAV